MYQKGSDTCDWISLRGEEEEEGEGGVKGRWTKGGPYALSTVQEETLESVNKQFDKECVR